MFRNKIRLSLGYSIIFLLFYFQDILNNLESCDRRMTTFMLDVWICLEDTPLEMVSMDNIEPPELS